MFNSFLYVWNSIDGDGTTSKFSTLACVLLDLYVYCEECSYWSALDLWVVLLQTHETRIQSSSTYQAVSARFTQIAGHQNFSIVLIHYLCEPNYIIGELRVQTELASQVLFFLPEKRGRRDERGQDERGGIKKRQKRRKGTRKKKAQRMIEELKQHWAEDSVDHQLHDSGSRKDQAKEKKRSGKEETSRKKTRRQCVVCQKEWRWRQCAPVWQRDVEVQ